MIKMMYSSILKNEDDLNRMYLAETEAGTPRKGSNHTVLSFSAYFKGMRRIVGALLDPDCRDIQR